MPAQSLSVKNVLTDIRVKVLDWETDMILCQECAESVSAVAGGSQRCTVCKGESSCDFEVCTACAILEDKCQSCGKPANFGLPPEIRGSLLSARKEHDARLIAIESCFDEAVSPYKAELDRYLAALEAMQKAYDDSCEPYSKALRSAADATAAIRSSRGAKSADGDESLAKAIAAEKTARDALNAAQKEAGAIYTASRKAADEEFGVENQEKYNNAKRRRASHRQLSEYRVEILASKLLQQFQVDLAYKHELEKIEMQEKQN